MPLPPEAHAAHFRRTLVEVDLVLSALEEAVHRATPEDLAAMVETGRQLVSNALIRAT